jgi:hypothetical protein
MTWAGADHVLRRWWCRPTRSTAAGVDHFFWHWSPHPAPTTLAGPDLLGLEKIVSACDDRFGNQRSRRLTRVTWPGADHVGLRQSYMLTPVTSVRTNHIGLLRSRHLAPITSACPYLVGSCRSHFLTPITLACPRSQWIVPITSASGDVCCGRLLRFAHNHIGWLRSRVLTLISWDGANHVCFRRCQTAPITIVNISFRNLT